MPHVIVIAGPNGAGKSTAAPALIGGLLGIEDFVNADVIARGLSAFNPEGAALEAGRIMLARLRELAAERRDFAFETTLASRSFAPWIGSLREDAGYEFHLNYLCVPDPELSIARVAHRSAKVATTSLMTSSAVAIVAVCATSSISTSQSRTSGISTTTQTGRRARSSRRNSVASIR